MICFSEWCVSGDVICLAVVASLVLLSLVLTRSRPRGLTARGARRSPAVTHRRWRRCGGTNGDARSGGRRSVSPAQPTEPPKVPAPRPPVVK